MLNKKTFPYIISITLLVLYFLLGYQVQRHETALLLGVYSTIFFFYWWIIARENQYLEFWIYAAIGFRFLLLFSVPRLSEDVYRFIWDGSLLAAGHHPFAHVPSYYIDNEVIIPGIDKVLYENLNSKNYFTVYPPVAQYLFLAAARVSSSIYENLLFLKAFIVVADIGNIFLLKALTRSYNLAQHKVLIYALNPLVILELSGNAHFEAILLFFILLSIYFLVRKKTMLAAVWFSIAISVKLIPLIFLPAIIPLLGKKTVWQFYTVVTLVCIILFLPLLDKNIIFGFQNSLGYYFSRFEFNASIYYFIRALGYLLWGQNIIYIAGGLLAAISTGVILMFSLRWAPKLKAYLLASEPLFLKDPKLFTFYISIIFSLFIYFIFATTIHPWYITTLLGLTVLTSYRFVTIWTLAIFFTYNGYTPYDFHENLWIVALEYLTVFGYLAYELYLRRQSIAHQDYTT